MDADALQDAAIPAGVELPDGRVLSFAPSPECGCADCTAAYRALERGELRPPDEGGLPWAA